MTWYDHVTWWTYLSNLVADGADFSSVASWLTITYQHMYQHVRRLRTAITSVTNITIHHITLHPHPIPFIVMHIYSLDTMLYKCCRWQQECRIRDLSGHEIKNEVMSHMTWHNKNIMFRTKHNRHKTQLVNLTQSDFAWDDMIYITKIKISPSCN